jgi:hypothetical protein
VAEVALIVVTLPQEQAAVRQAVISNQFREVMELKVTPQRQMQVVVVAIANMEPEALVD